ncbi:MAG: hypothetical protein BMS9Abin18_1421 [Zetaproteobacteria bacterium]|nr:MAG: hypothetical protein BMS9Abin18_1421 [Zetaproteobacteria bacterium]
MYEDFFPPFKYKLETVSGDLLVIKFRITEIK